MFEGLPPEKGRIIKANAPKAFQTIPGAPPSQFELEYELFNIKLQSHIFYTRSIIKDEQTLYSRLREATYKDGWNFHRIETSSQDGFPDCLVTKGPDYWLIECKRLYKKRLIHVQDDLKWQFAQLGFMKRAMINHSRYMLIVLGSIMYERGLGLNFLTEKEDERLSDETWNNANFAQFV